MLHSNLPQTERVRGLVFRDADATDSGIGEIANFAYGVLRRQYRLILFTTTLALGLSIFYLRITPPTYTATTQVLLNNSKAQFIQQQSVLAEPVYDLRELETQIQLIRSQAIALAIIKQYNIINDPDFNGSRVSFGSIWRLIRAPFAPSRDERQSDRSDEPSEGLIGAFLSRLQASRTGYSNIIEITYSSSSPTRAAEIANAVANTYVTDGLNAKFEANRSATTWLQDRLRELGDQALTAERAVNAYKAQNNIVSAGGKPIDEQQISDLNSRLVAARAQTSDALARLKRYETILRVNSASSSSIGTLDAAGSDALSSPILNSLRQGYLELSRRESEWSARFGHDHLAVVNLRSRMRDIRNSILDEVRRLSETSRSDYEVAKQREQEIEKQLNEAVASARTTNSAEVTLRELESRAHGYRSLYDTFLQRYMGSTQQESFPISEARVISPALTPESKSKPKSGMILALGALAGIAFGTALGLLRDLMDRVFRTSGQVESTLQLPCLAMTPLLDVSNMAKVSSGEARAPDDQRQRLLSTRPSVERAVIDMPLSRFAEAVRSIKLAIDLNPAKTSNKVIGLTSALPNEGKSTIAASVAQLIAHSGNSVILLDCDLRNPLPLSASLAPNATAGILEVIYGTRTLEETICRDPKTNLAFLPAVRRAPLLHTTEILSGEVMRKLFERLRADYQYVIVDLPPLSPVVDVRATSSLIDTFILVVEWGRTKIDIVQHALHTAPNIYESLIGAVLNKTDIKAMARYDSYHSDYYGDSHYSRYGFTDHA